MREVVLAQRVRYLAIADLAQPMLRVAGVRINPRTNAVSNDRYYSGFSVKSLPDGAETPIKLPADVRLGAPLWNATATMFAFTNEVADGIELWVGEAATGRVRRLAGVAINPLLGSSIQWLADQQTLLVKSVSLERVAPPAVPSVPPGPKIQESLGVVAASSSYETLDVLRSLHDADLFDFYATSQLMLVHAVSGKITPIGKPAVFGLVSAAPGGNRILVERIHRPYSYIRTYVRFPKEVEVWSTDGTLVETVASQPLADEVPIDGVVTGPRDHSWRPTEAATLVWAEALDGGNPTTKAAHRDRLMIKREGGAPSELCQTEYRFKEIQWIAHSGLALISDYDRDRRWTRTFIVNADDSAIPRRPLWDMSIDEKYQNPGSLIYRVLPTGARVVLREKDWIYLDGMGGSPEGDRPFLDRLDLHTLKTERLFRSDRTSFEFFRGWLDLETGTLLTQRESPTDPPNLFLRTLGGAPASGAPEGEAIRVSTARPVTRFPDPTPQIRGISKRLVTYTRADGVPLSFTLCLPPGYKAGTRLPTMLWAYPLEYADQNVAGQVEGSPNKFISLEGTSQLFLLLQGYAVLDNTAMPVIAPPETVYDTFNEQLVMNAQAAIDKAVELGVTDRNRVGVGGHSWGAMMTVALLAHSNLFRAGVARSGSYNKTLTPFGFRNEKRTLYEASDTYIKMSPLFHADKIRDPLLLMHGELDANPGSVPLESEKLYEAMRGIGKTVRLVMLPYEGHSCAARETTEHVLFELLSWFDRFVKHAEPRPATVASPNP
jgi:dipeptidyl aminopeptidase/acylaminoacyl peptidase